MERISGLPLDEVPTPIGPGYGILFDEEIDTRGFSELRVWVHVFVDNYETGPVTPNTRLVVRAMHQFRTANSFDYEEDAYVSDVTSYINGYSIFPIIGDRTRVLCHPENLPPGPYRLDFNYYLVR